ncbi:MAG TPA: pentapeptide repeat-containing protein [Candidatus Rubrimentiphilum sp.]|nr:pentapeptide repeat-containing protein [Candidatus Rubrimentiphilum sp.]
MNALAAFAEPAARIAVATLFNSLWEGAILALAVWALLNYLPNINATTRYAAWCVALIAALAVPVVTAIPQVSVQNAPALHHTVPVSQTTLARDTKGSAPSKLPANAADQERPAYNASQPAALAPSFPSRLRFALPQALALTIFAVWVVASLFLLLRLAVNLFKLEALKRDALPLSLDYREQLARWAHAEKGTRDVRLCVSEHIEVPVAVGLFDSMVLIPKHLLETLSEKEIDQITLHELAHLRRADDWTNGLQRIIQAIFFFNPAVLFIAQQLDLEREVACDDWVLHQTGDVRPYATCLTRMAEVTAWPHRALAAPGVFLTRRGLSIRVERLLRAGRNVRTSVSFGPAGAVAAALIVTFFVAQNVAPSFAFTLAAGTHSPVTHTAAASQKTARVAEPVKPAVTGKTAVVYRDKYLPATQAAFPPAMVAVATPTPRTVTKKTTKISKRTVIRDGMIDVNVPAVNVNIPKFNVNVPASNVLIPAIHVNIPAMRYKVPYGYKSSLKRVADLKGSCTGCDFSGVKWAGRNLSRVALVGSDFSNADLHGANLSYANLTGVDFTGANLRDVNFANANMEGCDMRRADLTGANFAGAHINGCDIEVSNLTPSQARAILAGCQGCDFRGANLRGQDLRGLSVSGDDFSSADLRGADMRNASFNGIDFKNAKLDGAHLDGASFNGCDFTGVDLRNVDLSHAQITGSKINIMR